MLDADRGESIMLNKNAFGLRWSTDWWWWLFFPVLVPLTLLGDLIDWIW
jgi:hypothetical protein